MTGRPGDHPPRRFGAPAETDVDSVLILAGGEPLATDILSDLPDPDFVVSADSGLDEALRLGIPVDLVVGDLDSASEASVEAARAAGVAFEIHETAKDQTDLELALDRAIAVEPERITVVGGGGGRLDHFLANAQLLAAPRYADARIEWFTNTAHICVVHNEVELHGTEGELITLLPVGGPAVGVDTEGLFWSLSDETLQPGTTRGVSNRFRGPIARVRVKEGVLLAVAPRSDVT